jgi:hypothetical protein
MSNGMIKFQRGCLMTRWRAFGGEITSIWLKQPAKKVRKGCAKKKFGSNSAITTVSTHGFEDSVATIHKVQFGTYAS